MQPEIRAGTSGYSYAEWKGTFYPEDLPAAEMLGFYARHFATVEINNTFYRMPKESVLAHWKDTVLSGFRFVLKVPKRITHIKRLREIDDDVAYFFRVAAALGETLGPALVQLPPNMKKDLDRLRGFSELVPADRRIAFEFRHDSWMSDDVFEVLRERDHALCVSDTDEDATPAAMTSTASWGYLRLRRSTYGYEDFRAWAGRIRAQPWHEAWVFFKHEEEGKGAEYAKRFLSLLD